MKATILGLVTPGYIPPNPLNQIVLIYGTVEATTLSGRGGLEGRLHDKPH